MKIIHFAKSLLKQNIEGKPNIFDISYGNAQNNDKVSLYFLSL